MTVAISYHLETSDLASHSKFFPAAIHVPHHQLRNFISTVYENKIYFVHDYDIYVIDLQTDQRTLVATVPFEARCLAAAHDWVCVGGEIKGDCAFLELDPDGKGENTFGKELIVEMLGKEIVNSMTIHKLQAQGSIQHSEIVVLISNNDKTVRLYSLSRRQVLTVLDHPVAMNYASMSADSQIIVAVGDSNEVFFYQRKDALKNDMQDFSAENAINCSWELLATPKVPFGEGVWDDYSFAVAFSSTGDLCAVSAQGGYITVLDMAKLATGRATDEELIVCTFKSSRPSLWGCVRSLSFSPAPWDLLAWTEDHGRAGIADVRQSFSRRQCITLDRNASKNVDVRDTTPAEQINLNVRERLKLQHLQRIRSSRGHLPIGARSFDNVHSSFSQQNSSSLDSGIELDQGERSILSALGTTIDDTETQVMRPYSVNYHPSPSIQTSAAVSSNQQYEVQLLNPETQMNAQNLLPQRRNSVILTDSASSRHLIPETSTRSYYTASPAPLSDDNSVPPMSTNDLTPSVNQSLSQPMPYNVPPSDPWHVIEAALGTNRPNPSSRHGSILAQIEFAIAAERRLANRLERQLADERRLAARLRTEIEDRERLLEASQQHSSSEQTNENRVSPTLERVLQRRLQIEHETGRQRSNELESEMRIQGQTVERLTSARGVLMEEISQPGELSPQNFRELSTLLATTSTNADIRELEATLRQLEEDRRGRRQRIQDLETEVRRAESRIEIASVHNPVERAGERERHHERLLDARLLQSARAGSSGTGSAWQLRAHDNTEPANTSTDVSTQSQSQPQTQASLNRVRAVATRRVEAGSGTERLTRLRSTELSGGVSESDIQNARLMLSRHSMDRNGNWIAASGYRRLFGAGSRAAAVPSVLARNGTESRSLEEVMRDEGLGTAGVGWSPDGKCLYVGTEAGIFEFKIHTKDRMCFPSIEFR